MACCFSLTAVKSIDGQGLAHVLLLFATPLGSLAVVPDSDQLGHVARFIGGNHAMIMAKRHAALIGRAPHFGRPTASLDGPNAPSPFRAIAEEWCTRPMRASGR